MFLKSDSSPKQFSFFIFDFNVSNETSSTPTRLLNFQEFSNYTPLSCLLSFEKFSNFHQHPTPVYSNTPSVRHARVSFKFTVRPDERLCKFIIVGWSGFLSLNQNLFILKSTASRSCLETPNSICC